MNMRYLACCELSVNRMQYSTPHTCSAQSSPGSMVGMNRPACIADACEAANRTLRAGNIAIEAAFQHTRMHVGATALQTS
jgi:hypothetical protein